jgi:hypothetical protein
VGSNGSRVEPHSGKSVVVVVDADEEAGTAVVVVLDVATSWTDLPGLTTAALLPNPLSTPAVMTTATAPAIARRGRLTRGLGFMLAICASPVVATVRTSPWWWWS